MAGRAKDDDARKEQEIQQRRRSSAHLVTLPDEVIYDARNGRYSLRSQSRRDEFSDDDGLYRLHDDDTVCL